MESILASVSERLWPELTEQRTSQRRFGYAKGLGVLYGLPLVAIGTLWLILVTEFAAWRTVIIPILALMASIWLFEQLRFFIVLEIRPGNFANAEGAITGLIIWSLMLIWGAEVLWAPLIFETGQLIWRLPRARTASARWEIWRDFALSHSAVIFAGLMAISAYQLFGGQIPITGLRLSELLPALFAIAVHFLIFCGIYLFYIGYLVWGSRT